jgi:hypothetical protein
MNLLEQVLSASGGSDRWRNVRRFTVHMTLDGLLIEQKYKPNALKEIVVEGDIVERAVRIMGVADTADCRLFCDPGKVGIESESGQVIRIERRSFEGWTRRAPNESWDLLDLAQFCGYSMWPLVATPHLLQSAVLIREDRPDVNGGVEPLRLMHVEFSEATSVYPLQQDLFFDSAGLLVRTNYRALELGGIPVSQSVSAYENFSGFIMPTLRRLRPIGFELGPSAPPVLDIEIFDFRPG